MQYNSCVAPAASVSAARTAIATARKGSLVNTGGEELAALVLQEESLVFSILVNDVGNPNDARHAQDRAAEILVAYLEGDAPAK